MSDRMHFQLALAGDTATLYVSGSLDQYTVSTLLDVCGGLPSRVRTLHVDLRALGTMTAEATTAVRYLLRHWREIRHGEFRLSTSHLVAAYSAVRAPMARTSPTGDAAGDTLAAACF